MEELKQCLLIDDDLDDQEIFIMCIEKISNNIKCTTANDGVEGLALLNSKTDYIPDFIFLDVNMPKMNGIECLKHIRQMEHLRNTKIYMYSTTSESRVVKECTGLGATDFVAKPARSVELKEKLLKIFGIVSEINVSIH
jgi:CheY-like chemotaxis protein